MVILNPQWQGSGSTDEIKKGAEIISSFLGVIDYKVTLSGERLSIHNNIIGYYPIYKQLKSFRDIIAKQNPENITTIGGDCGIEVIPVSYLNSQYKNLGIIWLDAHADLNTPESSPSKTFHGMPLRTLLSEGDKKYKELLFSTIKANQILFIGLRDVDRAEKEYIEVHDIFKSRDVSYETICQKLKKENFKEIYIHLDLDVIDPAVFSSTKCPSPNGLTIKDIEQLIDKLKTDFNVVGQSLCESVASKTDDLKPIMGVLNRIKNNQY